MIDWFVQTPCRSGYPKAVLGGTKAGEDWAIAGAVKNAAIRLNHIAVCWGLNVMAPLLSLDLIDSTHCAGPETRYPARTGKSGDGSGFGIQSSGVS